MPGPERAGRLYALLTTVAVWPGPPVARGVGTGRQCRIRWDLCGSRGAEGDATGANQGQIGG